METAVIAGRKFGKFDTLGFNVGARLADRGVELLVSGISGRTVNQCVAIANDIEIDHSGDVVPVDGLNEMAGPQEVEFLEVEEHDPDPMPELVLLKRFGHADEYGYRRGVVDHGVAQRTVTESGDPGCRFARAVETLPNGVSFPVLDIAPARTDTVESFTVPQGRLFVAGDNRDNSLDSRVPMDMGGVGLVEANRVHSKLRFVIGRDASGARFMGERAFAAD